MMTNRLAGWPRAALLSLALAPLAGCVDLGAGDAVAPRQPPPVRTLTYNCDHDTRLVVTSSGVSVTVTDPEGDEIELPASPPGQTSRYGRDLYALVIGDGEALWMKAGKPPVTCRR